MALADTDFLIDLMNPQVDHHQSALDLRKELGERGEPIYVGAPSRFELMTGIERTEHGTDHRHRVQRLVAGLACLDLDAEAADRAGQIHGRLIREGQRIGFFDAMIAAIALEHDLTLVTRNVSEFDRVQGLPIQTY